MDNFEGQIRALQWETQINRYQYLKTELDLCSTALDLGFTHLENGNRELAVHEVSEIAKGIGTITRFSPAVDDPGRRDEIASRLWDLQQRFDVFKSKLI